MRRIYFFLFLFPSLLVVIQQTNAQCINDNFSLQSTACIEENIPINTNSGSSVTYEWNYCSGALSKTPVVSSIGSLTGGISNPFRLKIFRQDDSYFGLSSSNGSGKLHLLEWGLDIKSIPLVSEKLAGISGIYGIDLVKEGDNWIGLATSRTTGNITRIVLGNNYSNTPTTELIPQNTGYTDLRGVKIVKELDNYYGFIATSPSSLLRLRFGNSLTNSPTITEISINGGSFISGLDFIKHCQTWYAVISGYSSGLHFLEFDSGLDNDPLQSLISTSSTKFSSVSLKADSAQFYGLASSDNLGKITKLSFGNSMNNSPDITDLGNFGVLSNPYAFTILENDNAFYGFGINYSDASLHRVDFEVNCEAINFRSSENPLIKYNSSGSFAISLKKTENGNVNYEVQTIDIAAQTAPNVSFSLDQNYCLINPINFTSSTISNIASYNWNFGDGNSSSEQSPIYQYSNEGLYNITLQVLSTEGCSNIYYDTLTILPEPKPEFTTTNAQYCTFETIDFINITPFDYGSNVSWNWDFNGEGNSTLKYPSFTFNSSGTKTITLQANVSGCSMTFQSNINIIDGPQVSFSYNGNCLGEPIAFTNLSIGDNITGYSWDFGNGETSVEENPIITYSQAGEFQVILTVSNFSNCANSSSQTIQLTDQVVSDILITKPVENIPFVANIDWVDSFDSTQNIDYEWEINNQIQYADTPQFNLPVGSYSLNLKVIPENGCIFNTNKNVNVVLSQIPSPDFNLPEIVCSNELIRPNNTSANSVIYDWDFCPGDLISSDLQITSSTPEDISVPVGASLIQFKGLWYGFVTNLNNNSISRLDFGNSLNNSPSIANLGNVGGSLSAPQDIKAVTENGELFLFVSNRAANKLIRINLGTDINSTSPTIDILLSGIQDIFNNTIDVIFDGENWVAIYSSSNFLRLIRLGDSLSNIPSETDLNSTSVINGINSIGGISFIKEENIWYAIASGYSSKTLVRLNFGNSIFSDPVSTDITPSLLSSLTPRQINIIKEGGGIFIFISTGEGNLIRLDFEKSILNTPIYNDLGNYNVLINNTKMDFARYQSSYIALTSDPESNKLFFIQFPNKCEVSVDYSQEDNPTTSYSTPGTYPITLTATHPNGSQASITKEITVTNNVAPEVAITSSSIKACIGNQITFEGTSPDAINNWKWSFGNGDSAFIQSPSYSFDAPGTYQIITQGIIDNGCKNLATQEINIYEPPLVSFNQSTQGTFCSQKPIDFFNTTILPTTATFSWNFGDGATSTAENPTHTFASAGTYTIILDIEMAGCLSSAQQIITVNPGPNLSFSTTNTCFGQAIEFINSSTGDFITGYQWDFGDGTSSTQENPIHAFDLTGEKTIRLTAITSNGCDYTYETIVNVFPLAEVNFEVEPACAGKSVQFLESVSIANANIVDYLWDFGLSGSNTDFATVANPTFTYQQAGTYAVDLQVVTEDGCVTNLTKTIVVSETPLPIITIGKTCIDQAVSISGNDNSTINTHFWQITDSTAKVIYTNTNPNFNYTFPYAGNFNISYRQENQNVCSNVANTNINILNKPAPFFTIEQSCIGIPISIIENTNLNNNQIIQYRWLLDGEEFSSTKSPSLVIERAGAYTVGLEVTTASGCLVSYTEQLLIEESPVPAFELLQNVAASPYELNTQTTLQAGEMANWYINNELISNEAVFTTTLEEIGVYLIGLEIVNEEGCSSRINKQISIKSPQLNISISNLQAIKEIDYTSFILSISNKGTLVPEYYNLNLTIGDFSVSEKLTSNILPGETINQALTVRLSEKQLEGIDRLCIEAEAINSSFKESYFDDNRSCINLVTEFKVLNVFPNPSSEKITLPIIMPASDMAEITIDMANGQTVSKQILNLEKGYNEVKLNIASYKAGIYLLKIRYQNNLVVKKVVFK